MKSVYYTPFLLRSSVQLIRSYYSGFLTQATVGYTSQTSPQLSPFYARWKVLEVLTGMQFILVTHLEIGIILYLYNLYNFASRRWDVMQRLLGVCCCLLALGLAIQAAGEHIAFATFESSWNLDIYIFSHGLFYTFLQSPLLKRLLRG